MLLNSKNGDPLLEAIAKDHNALSRQDRDNKHEELLGFFDVGTRYINLLKNKRSEFTDRFADNKYSSTETSKDSQSVLISAYTNYRHALRTALSQKPKTTSP